MTDFIDLRFWPAFNLADSFIVLGVLVLLAALLLPQRPHAAAAAGSRRSTLRVPDEAAGDAPRPLPRRAAGDRLALGGRAAASRAARPRGRQRATEELPPRGRRGARGRAAAGARARDRARRTSSFRVAYEDEHLLVVDKPAGVVVHPGAGHASGTLVHGLVGRTAGGEEDRPGHRPPARSRHLRAARRRPLGRGVRAASGARSAAGSSSATTSRSSAASRAPGGGGSTRRSAATGTSRPGSRSTPTRRATRSRTSRSPSSSAATRSLDVRLETGRTHQIRVHLAAIDLPGRRRSGLRRSGPGARTPVPAREPARVRASVHRRADRGRIAASADLAAYLGRLRGSG